MDQPNHSENQVDNSPAFVFTNSQGNVIFADQKFIRDLGNRSLNDLSGEHLHNILIMDSETKNQFIEAVKQESIVNNMMVSYSTVAGFTVKADCILLADRYETGDFLGMDVILYHMPPPDHLSENATKIMTHSDVIKAFVEMEMNSRNPLQPRTNIQSYIVAQFNALQIVLARIGGPAIRLVFKKLAKSTSRSMGLPIVMDNGNLNFSKKDIDINSYRSFMQTLSNYAVIVVGRNIVKREMLLVDKFVGRGTLELISPADLRIFSAE